MPIRRHVLRATLLCLTAACGKQVLRPAVFTPDGSAIVMPVEHGATCSLYRADIATGIARRLTGSTDGCEYFPAFSPDGQHLAFTKAPQPGAESAVMLANADGSNARILVPGDADNLAPIFIPHTNQIVFARSGAFDHHSPLAANRRHKFDLYTVDATTARVTRLTDAEFYDLSGVSVSADGQQLLLTVYDSTGYTFIVSPLDSPTVETRRIHPASFVWLGHAAWLPDGQSILFAGAARPVGGGQVDQNVYRFDVQSGAVDQLTHLTGAIDGYTVSTDGTKALILRGGSYSIVNLTTRALTPVPVTFE